MRSPPTRVGVIGAGFWAGFQLAAWAEQPDARVVAIANRSVDRAHPLADRFGIGSVHADAEAMLVAGGLDVVDIITAPDTHLEFVRLVASHGLPIICQKPLAPSLADARTAVAVADAAGVRLLVHENLLADVRGEHAAETSGADNLRTLELVEACYVSAAAPASLT